MQGEARNVRVWQTGNTGIYGDKVLSGIKGDVKLENLTENALGKANRD